MDELSRYASLQNKQPPGRKTRGATTDTAELNPDWRKRILERQAEETIGAPEAARKRAQAGWAVTSAVGTAVIATGAIAGIGETPLLTKAVGLTAGVLWLAATIGFLIAVSHKTFPSGKPERRPTSKGVAQIADSAYEIRRSIDGKIWAGIGFTIGAIAMTVIAASIWLFMPAAERHPSVYVFQGVLPMVSDTCLIDGMNRMTGIEDVDHSTEEVFAVELVGDHCGLKDGTVILGGRSQFVAIER